MSAACGGQAVSLEYGALLNLSGVSEAKVRQAIRCNATLRQSLRDALAQLPGVADASLGRDSRLVMAADLARGEYGPPAAEGLFARLSDASRARVLRGAGLPSSIKTWSQLSQRASDGKAELLISTLISDEYNAEAAAQSAEQLSQTESRFTRLSERGKLLITSKATSFGQAAVQWPELLRYVQSRNEVADLAALVELTLAKETAAEAKRAAATAAAATAEAKEALPGKPGIKADPHKKRVSKNLYQRRASVKKGS